MGDIEFEEFRKYFDKLPQYIKATPNSYTLIPNIALLNDDSPTGSTTATGSLETSMDSQFQEPFSGDLQVVYHSMDKESPIVVRKKRKLPEIPRNSNAKGSGTILPNQNPLKGIEEQTKGVSLAQELWDVDKSFSLNSGRRQNGTESKLLPQSGTQPYLFLKLNHRKGFEYDSSSPESDQYPSLDSGNSTIHSDDGSKSYSPQMISTNDCFTPLSLSSSSGMPVTHLELLEATHRGLHKFIPRHHDEIELEVGDPIYMQREADDLWCEGVNLRSGMAGIFPSAYVVDVEYNDFDPSATKVKKERYLTNYIGSIETLCHKGNAVLCQAVKKIIGQESYVASHKRLCILEISDQGIRMVEKRKVPVNQTPCHDYFYALKNISFCGFHPNDHRYFGFVTKHPTLNRFACHVFISDESTRPVAEAVGRAFQRFYQKFLETAYPIEDIYLE